MGKHQQQFSPPQPPKKPMVAFFIYRMEMYPKVKDQFPGLKLTEITREIGQMWKSEKPQDKQRYEKLAAIERTKFEKKRKQYEEKYGKPQNKKIRKSRIKKNLEFIRKHFQKRGWDFYSTNSA